MDDLDLVRLAWCGTYLVHSTLVLGAAWCVGRLARPGARVREAPLTALSAELEAIHVDLATLGGDPRALVRERVRDAAPRAKGLDARHQELLRQLDPTTDP